MNHDLRIIGAVEQIEFPLQGHKNVLARVDTGAKTSAVWASEIVESNGTLRFRLFAAAYQHFSGEYIETTTYEKRFIISSNGTREERYIVNLVVILGGRRIRASFSLANRASQTYPVLIGRNVLRGKFLVDVRQDQLSSKKGKL